jgi:hypothetical protein
MISLSPDKNIAKASFGIPYDDYGCMKAYKNNRQFALTVVGDVEALCKSNLKVLVAELADNLAISIGSLNSDCR